jgi:hypothetical protein
MHLPGIGAKKNPATEDDPRRGSPIHEPEGKSVMPRRNKWSRLQTLPT